MIYLLISVVEQWTFFFSRRCVHRPCVCYVLSISTCDLFDGVSVISPWEMPLNRQICKTMLWHTASLRSCNMRERHINPFHARLYIKTTISLVSGKFTTLDIQLCCNGMFTDAFDEKIMVVLCKTEYLIYIVAVTLIILKVAYKTFFIWLSIMFIISGCIVYVDKGFFLSFAIKYQKYQTALLSPCYVLRVSRPWPMFHFQLPDVWRFSGVKMFYYIQ